MKCWLIRSLALMLVFACTMAWGWSFHKVFSIAYGTTTSITNMVSLSGQLILARWKGSEVNNQAVGWSTGWHMDDGSTGAPYGEAFDGEFDPSMLVGQFGGFAIWRKADSPDEHFIGIAIPYWFIESTTVLIGLYIWRKTRHRRNSATAFPVEVKT